MYNIFGVITLIAAVSLYAYGWVMNIINLINGTYEATSTIIMGFIGIIVPIVGPITHFVAG